MFNLISILPNVMDIGEDIMKCLDGEVTTEEWNKTVDDFYKLALNIPQVQGVLGIIEIVSMITKFAFPMVDSYLNKEDAPEVAKVALPEAEREKAKRSMKFFNDVNAKVAKHNGLKNNSPDKTDDNWTESFFEEFK